MTSRSTIVLMVLATSVLCTASSHARSTFFESQTFAITNAVAASDFFTRSGDQAFATVYRFDDPLASPERLSNPALGYDFDALALETPLEPGPAAERRTSLVIELIHENYHAGGGDFFPAGLSLNGLQLEHQVFAFGGVNEPEGLFAPFDIRIESARFRTFAFDGSEEVAITDFAFFSDAFDGGAGFWSPPPGVSVGNGVNRIVWEVTFAEVIPGPSAAALLGLGVAPAIRRRRN